MRQLALLLLLACALGATLEVSASLLQAGGSEGEHEQSANGNEFTGHIAHTVVVTRNHNAMSTVDETAEEKEVDKSEEKIKAQMKKTNGAVRKQMKDLNDYEMSVEKEDLQRASKRTKDLTKAFAAMQKKSAKARAEAIKKEWKRHGEDMKEDKKKQKHTDRALAGIYRMEKGKKERASKQHKRHLDRLNEKEKKADERDNKKKERAAKKKAERAKKAEKKVKVARRKEARAKSHERKHKRERTKKRQRAERSKKQAVERSRKARQRKERGAKKRAEQNRKRVVAQSRRRERAAKARQNERRSKEVRKKKTQLRLSRYYRNYGGSYLGAGFKIVNKRCYLHGLIRGPRTGYIGRLPRKCSPNGRLIFTVKRGSSARVDILHDGRIYYITGGSASWLSLSGISFTIKTAGGDALQLTGRWQPYGYSYRRPSITHEDGFCQASGIIRSGVWHWAMARVMRECWPRQRLIFSGNNHATITRLDVMQNGYIARAYGGGTANHHWVALDGILYHPEGGRNLPLYNGWRTYGGIWQPLKVHKEDGVCVVSGLIKSNRWSSHITTLPSECHPKGRLIFGCNSHTRDARVDVLRDGRVVYVGEKGVNWLSLTGIHFVP